jgi:pyruvate dehydrogenase E2 component (dihydrolipoamide acetyltransferase)
MSTENTPEAYFAQFGEIEAVKRTRFQKIVAKTMVNNASTIPHVTHQDDADVTGLEAYRKSLGPHAKISPLIFLIKAVVEALKAFPQFNASLTPDGETLVMKKFFHIGIAVDGPLGLLVPVLRDAGQKDTATLAAELREVSALARAKGLPMDKMQGGCFSITSLGGIGGTYFTPIINAPEVAILGVTGIKTKPVWNGHEFVPRQLMPLSLSYDHRVINGADAARFVHKIAAALTQWDAV